MANEGDESSMTPLDTLNLLGTGGACNGTPTEVFFPVGEKNEHSLMLIAKAQAMCASCPLVDMCAEYAIEHEDSGIWGGLTETDRREIRARRSAAA